MAGTGDVVADVEQVGGGFEQFARRRRQAMQRVQRREQQAGDVRHAPRVFHRYPVAAAHILHLPALLAGEAG